MDPLDPLNVRTVRVANQRWRRGRIAEQVARTLGQFRRTAGQAPGLADSNDGLLCRDAAEADGRAAMWRYSRIFKSEVSVVTDTDRTQCLRIALATLGLLFVLGIYPLTVLSPAGWSWHAGQSMYLQMILGIMTREESGGQRRLP
jgi:hypothetical protein